MFENIPSVHVERTSTKTHAKMRMTHASMKIACRRAKPLPSHAADTATKIRLPCGLRIADAAAAVYPFFPLFCFRLHTSIIDSHRSDVLLFDFVTVTSHYTAQHSTTQQHIFSPSLKRTDGDSCSSSSSSSSMYGVRVLSVIIIFMGRAQEHKMLYRMDARRKNALVLFC